MLCTTTLLGYNGCGYRPTGDGHRDALGMGKSGPHTGLLPELFRIAWCVWAHVRHKMKFNFFRLDLSNPIVFAPEFGVRVAVAEQILVLCYWWQFLVLVDFSYCSSCEFSEDGVYSGFW